MVQWLGTNLHAVYINLILLATYIDTGIIVIRMILRPIYFPPEFELLLLG